MLGALILVGGSAGDRFGQRRVFILGVAIFTAASIACGFAPNVASLIAARVVQGVGGALLVPSSLAIISEAFPARERGKAIGTWAGLSAIATALGPPLGGWFVDMLSWRAIFFINVPIALTTLALAVWHVPESRTASAGGAVDWTGGVLATLGLGALAYGLTAASELSWTQAGVLGPLAASALAIAAFVWWEARATSPMVPLALFRSGTFSGVNLMTLLLYCALTGALFLLPFNLIRIQHYSATFAGAAFLPFTLIMGGLSSWSGGLVNRYGARGPLILGPIVAAAGFAMFAIPGIGGSYWTTFFPAMAVLGLGMAITVAPLTTIVMSAVGDERAGTASAINNAVSQIAGMLAVAVLGALAVAVFSAAIEPGVAELHLPSDIRNALEQEVPRLAEAHVPEQVQGEVRHKLEQILADSFVQSFRAVTLVAAGLALISALFALWMIKEPDLPVAGRRVT
jgi:EmrB/QacA subfamily drug resistance transporter